MRIFRDDLGPIDLKFWASTPKKQPCSKTLRLKMPRPFRLSDSGVPCQAVRMALFSRVLRQPADSLYATDASIADSVFVLNLGSRQC
jgi:hypothetical protein